MSEKVAALAEALLGVPPPPSPAEEASVVRELHARLRARLEEEGLGGLYRDVEMPLVEILAEMEVNGILLAILQKFKQI